MARWLAIDHGSKRFGVAVGTHENAMASPVAVLSASPAMRVFQEILKLADQYNVAGIVIGWPLNMDDSEGPQAVSARAMAMELSTMTSLDVRLWDERLSSFTADNALAGHLTRKKRRARQDSLAAATILQDFFSRNGPDVAPRPRDMQKPKK